MVVAKQYMVPQGPYCLLHRGQESVVDLRGALSFSSSQPTPTSLGDIACLTAAGVCLALGMFLCRFLAGLIFLNINKRTEGIDTAERMYSQGCE